MNPSELLFYCAPESHAKLDLRGDMLIAPDGHSFAIENGVPNLVWPAALSAIEAKTKVEYDNVAERIYDAALDWQFAALREDEETVREFMINMLDLKPGARILEVGCGTGRDSYRLARRLGSDGHLFLQDLSSGMVHACVKNMETFREREKFECAVHYSISNATYLPFEDNYFDAVFHFGGFNEFSDGKKTGGEFARVVKPGGTVLYGDESVGPWLRDADFGRIVINNNPLFAHKLPLESIPLCARDVNVRWMMANCFYVISFRKGDGPPPLDLDLVHQGWRGGSMRSRYYGVMEGVTPEAKEMAKQAAATAGVSIHEWLDRLVRRQAAEDISAKSPNP